MSRDFSQLLTASWDRSVKLWQVQAFKKTRKPAISFTGHTNGVVAAEFSSDLSKIVTAASDGSAKIWNAQTGDCLRTIKGQGAVYVVGGCSLQLEAQAAEAFMVTLRHCEIYLPEQNRWVPTGALQIPRSGTRVVALGLVMADQCLTTCKGLPTRLSGSVPIPESYRKDKRLVVSPIPPLPPQSADGDYAPLSQESRRRGTPTVVPGCNLRPISQSCRGRGVPWDLSVPLVIPRN
eukprot:Skav200213  [mRNA]  locus=scaffold714:3197:20037:+ [translate_table: standard]